jgi:hypothetical protein
MPATRQPNVIMITWINVLSRNNTPVTIAVFCLHANVGSLTSMVTIWSGVTQAELDALAAVSGTPITAEDRMEMTCGAWRYGSAEVTFPLYMVCWRCGCCDYLSSRAGFLVRQSGDVANPFVIIQTASS